MNKETEPIPEEDDLSAQRAEALKLVKGSLFSINESNELAEENEKEINYDAQNEALDYQIRLDKITSRKKWDKWLLVLVVVGFFLSYLMILMIGLGWLKFPNSTFAVPSVVGAGVVETYGLAKIAARYFFSDDDTKRRKRK